MACSCIVLAAIWLAAALPGPRTRQNPPCLTDSANAAVHAAAVGRDLGWDSTLLASQGLPYRPAIALVTDSAGCAGVIGAYNALFRAADSANRIARAYVLAVGDQVLAMVPENAPDVHIYFSRADYTWLAGLVQPH